MSRPAILTVSELTSSIRGLLESTFPFVTVCGEISNLRKPFSGHFYFTLKDASAQIKAVLFKMQQRYLGREPQDGDQVILRGRVSVYEPRGDYQLIADTLEYQGAGNLQLAFEQLKQRLFAEGLFDASRKKRLPAIPGHITLITSPGGAAVHDFIRVASHRFPLTNLSVYPVSVQGEAAAREMVAALHLLNDLWQTDILVLCRGGGSLEDLQPFNEEMLARAIAASHLPVVSAVGHEIDTTIADLVADLRAPTPSAAAELLLPDRLAVTEAIAALRQRQERAMTSRMAQWSTRLTTCRITLGRLRQPLDRFLLQLDYERLRLDKAMTHLLERNTNRLELLRQRIVHQAPQTRLQRATEQLKVLIDRLQRAMEKLMHEREEALRHTTAIMDSVSPLATLARGYAIVKTTGDRGRIVTDSVQVAAGEKVEVTLHHGRLHCHITATETENTAPVGAHCPNGPFSGQD